MGVLCTPIDVMALRHIRQKNFAKIQPLFDDKYTAIYDPIDLWYSFSDDASNGISLSSYDVGVSTCTNVSIASPDVECFHLQSTSIYTDYKAYYVADNSQTDVQGENTITAGVSLRFSNPNDIQNRDQPWEKYAIYWSCATTLKTQKSTWTGEFGGPSGNTPIYTDWSTISTATSSSYNEINPTSLANQYNSNSLYIPPQTNVMGEGIYSAIAIERTRFLGSISVYGITIYRQGDYHHA